MAVPAFRAAGTLLESIGTLTVNAAPAGLATDDIEFLVCESMDEAVSLTTTGGFVEVTGSPVSAPHATDALLRTRLTVYWRRWATGLADPITNDPGNHIGAYRVAFSGCIATGNPWDTTIASSETVDDGTGSATGGTTSVGECLIAVFIAHAKPDLAGGTAEMSAHTNADLTSVTERYDDAFASGNGGWLGLITGEKATAGAFTATTYTKAVVSYKAHLVVALKPPEVASAVIPDILKAPRVPVGWDSGRL
ncbi:MAG: hypothetical protein H0W31_00265 [Actinobacteria bacterium]|nr:hypothetical protein [Actinomycetota bacterium]